MMTPESRRVYKKKYTAEQIFFSKVHKGSCWNWTGNKCKKGYGRFWDGSRLVLAHRWSMQELNLTPIPDGLVLNGEY